MAKKNILIVDDTLASGDAIAARFDQNIVEVFYRESIHEGRALLHSMSNSQTPENRFAVAIIDLHFGREGLPLMTLEQQKEAGLGLIVEARNVDPYLEIICITAYDQRRAPEEVLRHGGFRYIRKDKEKDWPGEVKKAALEAIRVRDEWLSIHNGLLNLGEGVDKIETAMPSLRGHATRMRNTLADLRNNFDRILKSRGHKAGL